jgi:DeoR/GlpR family transcriptional regulator of sugar metabolism
MLVREREGIARVASKLIKAGDVLLIGAGATTLHVARRISVEHRDITVVNHSFDSLAVLSSNRNITALCCPGRLHPAEGFIHGPETVEFLRSFHANYAFLGASGLTADGPNDVSADAAAVYRAMIERAAQTVIVADHSKFGRPSLAVFARWREIDRLITDHALPAALAAALKKSGVDVSIASSGN